MRDEYQKDQKYKYQEFRKAIEHGIKTGAVSLSKPVSELDMAVQFAIGSIQERCGVDYGMTMSEIYDEILSFTDESVFKKNCGWFFELVQTDPVWEPDRKKGKWIKHEHGFWTHVNEDGERAGWIPDYECSECGSRGWKNGEHLYFCPNCGADMRGDQNE